ncbi:MAG TPA: hypothetical protein VFD64_11080 [Gemmatimonadaceae bacterium]|nr:hypothetical protein [Gemmatimonadaceae bacterium]
MSRRIRVPSVVLAALVAGSEARAEWHQLVVRVLKRMQHNRALRHQIVTA